MVAYQESQHASDGSEGISHRIKKRFEECEGFKILEEIQEKTEQDDLYHQTVEICNYFECVADDDDNFIMNPGNESFITQST